MGNELRTPVRDDVGGDPMESNNMVDQKICSLSGCGKLGKSNKVYHLGKSVHNDGISFDSGSPVTKSKATCG